MNGFLIWKFHKNENWNPSEVHSRTKRILIYLKAKNANLITHGNRIPKNNSSSSYDLAQSTKHIRWCHQRMISCIFFSLAFFNTHNQSIYSKSSRAERTVKTGCRTNAKRTSFIYRDKNRNCRRNLARNENRKQTSYLVKSTSINCLCFGHRNRFCYLCIRH